MNKIVDVSTAFRPCSHLGNVCLLRLSLIVVCGFAGFFSTQKLEAQDDSPPPRPIWKSFQQQDANQNQQLELDEFLRTRKDKPRFTRDFHVLDFNQDGGLDIGEYACHPGLNITDPMAAAFDPIKELVKFHLNEIEQQIRKLNQTPANGINAAEFDALSAFQAVPGLKGLSFVEWDRDGDGRLTLPEVNIILEAAFGVRLLSGVALRDQRGRVLDYRSYRALAESSQGIAKQRFFNSQRGQSPDANEARFSAMDTNTDGFIALQEWANSPAPWFDPIKVVLGADADFNGTLSPTEINKLQVPPGQRSLNHDVYAMFDDNHDGEISLPEYQRTPSCNPFLIWNTAIDSDGNGALSAAEFHTIEGIEFAALSAMLHQRLDADHDGTLQLYEYRFNTDHPLARFVSLDLDQDQKLSQEEYAAILNEKNSKRLLRDFRLADFNQDDQLTFDEYSVIPELVPLKFRRPLPLDPVVERKQQMLTEYRDRFQKADRDQSGTLSTTEFEEGQFFNVAMQLYPFEKWDANADAQIDDAELSHVLDLQWGIRSNAGAPLRNSRGETVDIRSFMLSVPTNSEQMTQSRFLESVIGKSAKNPAALFKAVDLNQDGDVTLKEWTSRRALWRDTLGLFRGMDTNLDAKVDQQELNDAKLPEGQKLFTRYLLSGFDDDGDGLLNFQEFRYTPLCNLLAQWGNFAPTHIDDRLTRMDVVSLCEHKFLAEDYFNRIDLDGDRQLDLREWPMRIDRRKAPPEAVFLSLDEDRNDLVSLEEIMGPRGVPQKGKPFDVQLERKFLRTEEAFKRADQNEDGALSLSEFDTPAGQRVLHPESTQSKARQDQPNAENLPLFSILGFNIIMIGIFAYFLMRKAKAT